MGLRYICDYLSPGDQKHLLAIIDQQPWNTALKRRVQHYGYRYDYTRRTIDHSLALGSLPPWARDLALQLERDGLVDQQLDQLIINEYHPGQGIASHIDCIPCFKDTILSISLGSPCVMLLTNVQTHEQLPLLLEPGSAVILAGEARYEWKHGIPARRTDQYANQTIVRARRVSLTFRTVILQNAQMS